MAAKGYVTGGGISAIPPTSGIVTGGGISGGSSSTQGIVTGGGIMSSLEPFTVLNLPPGTWTQTAGPTNPPPTVTIPGAPFPGTSLTYTQPNGTSFTIGCLPHTKFGISSGVFYAINSRPGPL